MYLLRAPAACLQTLPLRARGAGHADDLVEVRGGVRFIQQWNDDHRPLAAFGLPPIKLFPPGGADARMQDVFQAPAGGRIAKNQSRKFIAPEAAIITKHAGAESSLDLHKRGLTRLDKLPGKRICVHHRQTPFTKHPAGRGFAHSHPAGQTISFHG